MFPSDQAAAPAMRVMSQQTIPRDITDKFTKAASTLRTGQLVKDEYFTLFESVGALEMMDPKMDSGYLGPGENHAQALEDDYDVMRELAPEEVVGIMDKLLCHEMAWHMGHPLSQTLFTSIYLDKLLWPVPKIIEDTRFDRHNQSNKEDGSPLVHLVLRAYCLALVKACDFVHARAISEFYYEEEDFVTQLYNRSLLTPFDVGHFQKLIDEAVAWIDQGASLDEKLRDAIKYRLRFRRDFLAAVEQDIGIMETRSSEHFVSCLKLLPRLKESFDVGKPVPEAFSLKIQRKLASTLPPRPMVNVSPEDAMQHLTRLCEDAIDLNEIIDYRGPYNLKVAVWTLLSRKPHASVYIRSLAQSIVVNDLTILGSVPLKQFLYNDLAELVLPSSVLLQANMDETEMPSNPRFQIAQMMDGFVKRITQPYLDSLRYPCLNRCRVRRTLCHSVLEWDTLQFEAEELDVQLRTLSREPPLTLYNGQRTFAYPLGSWCYHQKLIQLRTIVQLGFELSIYSPEELPGMYWYLNHLCASHIGHLNRIRTFVLAADKLNPPLPGMKRVAAERQAAYQRSLRQLDQLTNHLIATAAFAMALHALYALLARHNLLPCASSPQAYSSGRLRYELRMKPFIPISLPEIVPYEEFVQETTLEGDSDATVLERATKAISEARKAWETTLANGAFFPQAQGTPRAPAIEGDWNRDAKNTMRACIATSITIETMKKALGASAAKPPPNGTGRVSLRVELPEQGSRARWHDWWIVPQISQKQDSMQ